VRRDPFLDLLRTVSVTRVVLLHVLTRPPIVYLPWIQWIYPGMPEVFFVSGAVMAVSLAKRDASTVVRGRLRRLLPPFVPYALAALLVMRVTDVRSADPAATLRWGDVLTWLVPFLRAEGSETRVILWGHVWFLSAFLWLIVLAPLVAWLRRRLGRFAGAEVAVPLAGFATVVAWEKLAGSAPREELVNATLFGTFFVLGFSYVDGWLGRLKASTLTAMAVACAAAGTLTALVIEPIHRKPLNELYSSHTAHLLIGGAWLFAALAVAGPVRRWAEGRRLGCVGFLTQRTYTLFLWGPAANAVAVTVAKRLMPDQAAAIAVLLGLAFVVLLAVTVATGWVEDWAARRPLRLVPRWGGSD
jgi:peptidoglycan/LPS O-acetylase OafA/YrhL